MHLQIGRDTDAAVLMDEEEEDLPEDVYGHASEEENEEEVRTKNTILRRGVSMDGQDRIGVCVSIQGPTR